MTPQRLYFPNLQVCWHSNGRLWATEGYDVISSSNWGETWNLVATVPARPAHRFLIHIAVIRRLLRLGVRSYLQVDDEIFIVFSSGGIFLRQADNGQIAHIGRTRHGNGPLLYGCCKDASSNCYFGEYWANPDRISVNIYTWHVDAVGWRPFYSFPAGTIRHIHAVQFDPFTERVWIATGDKDEESFIGYFEGTLDEPNLVTVASGSQSARAVSLVFTSKYVYWGSDAGKDTHITCNWIYRWSRKNGQIERLAPMGGPVYYSTMDAQGRLFVSTGVEGSSSEPDHFARVWMSEDGRNWQEIARWKKDAYPMLFGYGVLSFPQGVASNGRLYVVGQGVRGAPGTWVLEV